MLTFAQNVSVLQKKIVFHLLPIFGGLFQRSYLAERLL